MAFTTDPPPEGPVFGVIPEGVEVRQPTEALPTVLRGRLDRGYRPAFIQVEGDETPVLGGGPVDEVTYGYVQGVPVMVDPVAPENQVIFTTPAQWLDTPAVQQFWAQAGAPGEFTVRITRTKTKLDYCAKCEAELTEADCEAGKCTQCGAFYNVPDKPAEPENDIPLVTCPVCGRPSTRDATYGELCYRCIRAPNE